MLEPAATVIHIAIRGCVHQSVGPAVCPKLFFGQRIWLFFACKKSTSATMTNDTRNDKVVASDVPAVFFGYSQATLRCLPG